MIIAAKDIIEEPLLECEQKVNNCRGAYRRHQRETQGGALVGLAFWQQAFSSFLSSTLEKLPR
jgi:hypothetical protein